jgi:hypothetical protein
VFTASEGRGCRSAAFHTPGGRVVPPGRRQVRVRTTYSGTFGERQSVYRNSLFQKRLEIEIDEFCRQTPCNVNGVVQADAERPDLAVFAVVLPGGAGATADAGSVRIPKRAYDVYPFNPEDDSVRQSLEAIRTLLRRAAGLAHPTSS